MSSLSLREEIGWPIDGKRPYYGLYRKVRFDLSRTENPDGTQSVRRVLVMLRALAMGQGSGLGLQEAADVSGLTRPTAHRILKTLVQEGFAEQHPRSRRYSIGEQIPLLALARARRPVLLDAAEAIVEKVAQEIGDTAFLTIRTGDDTLCIARRLGNYPIQVLVIEVGARRPLGVSVAGLAILSQLSGSEAHAIIRANLPRFRRYRLTEDRVLDRLRKTQKQGFAISDPGLVPGTKALAVAIVDAGGNPLGALTVAAVRARLRAAREKEVYEALLGHAHNIADHLSAIASP